MTQTDTLYGLKDQERLDTEPDDVIQRVVDDGHTEWPVEVLEFRRMDIPSAEWLGKTALENMLETLDEEHSDPEGNGTEPTDAMITAALAFGEAIRKDYVSWACEPTGKTIWVNKPTEEK